MALPRRAYVGDIYDKVIINIYDITKKEIIFTGTRRECGVFLGVPPHTFNHNLTRKHVFQKKYALRYATQKTN